MRLACVSDLHGNLPDLSNLDFDILLVGGDICPTNDHKPKYQANWLNTIFRNWLKAIDKPVVAVAGNHDFVFERLPNLVPDLPWIYLQDSGATIGDLKIWGSPHQKRFYNWAFNADEAELKAAWDKIPEDTDIFLLHGPPYGLGDYTMYSKEHTGSPSLRKRIEEVKPKLVVYGHIHEGYGRYEVGSSIIVNASFVNERYEPVNPIQVVDI